MKRKFVDQTFFERHCSLMNLGYVPFTEGSNRFSAGPFSLRGRSYYLRRRVCPKEPSLWNTTIVCFYDLPPGSHPCVLTMLKAANHFAVIKARQLVELTKVFDVCS